MAQEYGLMKKTSRKTAANAAAKAKSRYGGNIKMKAKLEKFQPLKGKDDISLLLTCSKADMQEVVSFFDQEVKVERYSEEKTSDLDTAIELTSQAYKLMEELSWELTKLKISKVSKER